MSKKTSPVREQLIQLLYIGGPMTAYDAYKYYIQLFSRTTQRNVYYQLEKGTSMGLFDVETKTIEGDFRWGPTATKKYYSVTAQAQAKVNERVRDYFANINKKQDTENGV